MRTEQDPRRVAGLIDVSSATAHQFHAINGVYALVKAGVNAFSESLRQEVTERHGHTSVTEPGAMKTA
jgi:short-subunit dehydrogenase